MDSKMRALSRSAGLLVAGAVVAVPALTAVPAAAAGSIAVIADFEGGAPDGFFSYGAAGFGYPMAIPGGGGTAYCCPVGGG